MCKTRPCTHGPASDPRSPPQITHHLCGHSKVSSPAHSYSRPVQPPHQHRHEELPPPQSFTVSRSLMCTHQLGDSDSPSQGRQQEFAFLTNTRGMPGPLQSPLCVTGLQTQAEEWTGKCALPGSQALLSGAIGRQAIQEEGGKVKVCRVSWLESLFLPCL